jgi:hypothetical protein
MPPAFKDTTCWYTFSSSAGLEPAGVFRINMRLAFWHDKQLSDEELKRWMAPYPACATVYRTIQPIYVNKPRLAAGVRDPLEGRCARSGLVRGARDVVVVPDIPAETAEAEPRGESVELPPGAGLAEMVALIGDGPGQLGCNEALEKVIGLFWRRFPRGNAAELEAAIRKQFASATWDEKKHSVAYRNQKLADLKGFIRRIHDAEWNKQAAAAAVFDKYEIPPREQIRKLPALSSIAARSLKVSERTGIAPDTYENAMRAVAASGLAPAWNELKMVAELTAPDLPVG